MVKVSPMFMIGTGRAMGRRRRTKIANQAESQRLKS
jgi:hypothetical protein